MTIQHMLLISYRVWSYPKFNAFWHVELCYMYHVCHSHKQAGVAILGPFPRTAKDNKFIVAMWDYFTKWPEAQALPYTSSLLVARFLYSTMTRWDKDPVLQILNNVFFSLIELDPQGIWIYESFHEDIFVSAPDLHEISSVDDGRVSSGWLWWYIRTF